VKRSVNRLILLLVTVLLIGCTSRERVQPPASEASGQTEPLSRESSTETMSAAAEIIPEKENRTMPQLQNPRDTDFVAVTDYLPEIRVELRYSTDQNFTGQTIYGFNQCYLRYGTVRKLMQVSAELMQQGLYLKIWDGFRPASAQFDLWAVCPDSTYVANPNVGFSSHSRGNTVDVTLVDEMGREVEMPTDFDDFSQMADRDYSDCGEAAAENARLLESVMKKYGFSGYWGEWWHYSDTVKYDVEMVFDPGAISRWYAHCEEYITLRSRPDMAAQEVTRIPAGREMLVLGYTGDYAMVDFEGLRGYVLSEYIRYNGITE